MDGWIQINEWIEKLTNEWTNERTMNEWVNRYKNTNE